MPEREVSAYPKSADVQQLHSAAEMHEEECDDCSTGSLCVIGERLSAAVEIADAELAG